MGKGANKQLLNNSGTAQSLNKQLSGTGSGISNFITPQLEGDVTNPQGYTPEQLAYINTADQQSLGGSVGGITGEANLEAARTRNKGGFQGVAGSAARSAQRQLSENALGVQKANADLEQQKRQQAIDALMKLYGVDESTALGYLNSSTEALSNENKSHPNQQGLLTAGTFINDIEGGKGSSGLKLS